MKYIRMYESIYRIDKIAESTTQKLWKQVSLHISTDLYSECMNEKNEIYRGIHSEVEWRTKRLERHFGDIPHPWG